MEELSSTVKPEPLPESKILNGEPNDENKDISMGTESTDESDIVKMEIQGFEDENEESVIMTVEEAQRFIQSKAMEYMKNPEMNPLLILKTQIAALQKKIKLKNDDLSGVYRVFEVLYRDQVRFLRHIGVMEKAEMKTVGVSVDLPWLPESVSGVFASDAFKPKNTTETSSSQPNTGSSTTSSSPTKPVRKEPSGPIECIDLTDDLESPPASSTGNKDSVTITPIASAPAISTSATPSALKIIQLQHPAPLPSAASTTGEIPPKPRLKISVDKNGIVLQWDLPPIPSTMKINGFEIYGYQEKPNVSISSALWKKIGCVNPMPLPMSCTLTQFVEGFKYHFSIRATCPENKYGVFSDPASIMFIPETKKV